MANTVSARAPAWVDGIPVPGAEMRAAIPGTVWANAGLVRGLQPVQIPTPDMHIRVPAGLCEVSDGQSGYIGLELAAQTDLDIAAAHATLPRIDSLIAEFVDNGASSLYRFRILTGTPNASPSAPSLPAADQLTGKTLRIANVAVGAAVTSIVQANISLQTSIALMATYGRLQSVSSDGGRPASPVASEGIWRSDKLCLERWNGTAWAEGYLSLGGPAWKTYTPALTASTSNPALGTGNIVNGSYLRIGRLVTVNVNFLMGSGATAGNGIYRVSLPFTAKTLTTGFHYGVGETFDDSANDVHDAVVRCGAGAGFDKVEFINEGTLWGNTAPFGLAANDTFGFTMTYETAS